MLSRTNSTSELNRGLSHILLDANGSLPDDLESLEDGFCVELLSHNMFDNTYFLFWFIWGFIYATTPWIKK